jgi:hypothetical protein
MDPTFPRIASVRDSVQPYIDFFFSIFFLYVHTRGKVRIQTSNIRFMRHNPQLIKLPLRDNKILIDYRGKSSSKYFSHLACFSFVTTSTSAGVNFFPLNTFLVSNTVRCLNILLDY